MPTIGTEAPNNIPIYYKFIYGGVEVGWNQPYKINALVNSGESIDGDYRISDLDVYFLDRYGSIFENHFGNGTVGFGSTLQAIAYLGGTVGYAVNGLATAWVWKGTAGAYVATMHTGRIFSLSYKDRLIRIRSKSRMAHLGDLKYQHPVKDHGDEFVVYGSFAFYNSGNLAHDRYGSECFYELDQNRTQWKCAAYQLATSYGPNGYLSVNGFPRMAGRGTGTLPLRGSVDDTWYYPGTNSGGTNFYETVEPTFLVGSYLGSYIGTINTHEEAQEYGYSGILDAEANRQGAGPYYYVINKSRLKASADLTGSFFHFLAPIIIEGTPKDMFESLMTGAMVTPLFGTTDLDTTTLNETATTTAFFGMRRKVWFKEKNVVDDLKDLFDSTQALFSVNPSDKFEFRTYGPRNLNTTIPSLGTSDIISSEFNNYEDDYYNRFVFRYKWDGLNNEFGSVYEEKAPSWSPSNDRPKVIESKFTINPNEAVIMTQRVKSKYIRTFPHIDFTTNINKLGVDIGTLFRITDPNSGLNDKIVQVIGYRKDWQNRTIDFECYDGEALYQRRGYAYWEDGTLSVLPDGTISGTSTAGWGTTDWQGINTAIYGTSFVWW
jgi:hypothetical protein